ncbi:hypothetical protein TNCV_1964131 [Trichonephila clavipes]|nr:hypothetical protein TNCV_1964131 [Trichonephila clavipes]
MPSGKLWISCTADIGPDSISCVPVDPDTVLIRVESMIESTTDSNEFRFKDGKVIRIPDADFNITPGSVTKYAILSSTRIFKRLPSE